MIIISDVINIICSKLPHADKLNFLSVSKHYRKLLPHILTNIKVDITYDKYYKIPPHIRTCIKKLTLRYDDGRHFNIKSCNLPDVESLKIEPGCKFILLPDYVLPATIKSLKIASYYHQLKDSILKIIPKYLTHIELYTSADFNILSHLVSLKKLTIVEENNEYVLHSDKIELIPDHVTSIYYKNMMPNSDTYNIRTILFNLKPTVTKLHMYQCKQWGFAIPSFIKILKLDTCKSYMDINNTHILEKLYIKNLLNHRNTVLFISKNITNVHIKQYMGRDITEAYAQNLFKYV